MFLFIQIIRDTKNTEFGQNQHMVWQNIFIRAL